MNAVLQYVLYVAILVAVALPLGIYMSKIMGGEKNIVSRVLGPVERQLTLRLLGQDGKYRAAAKSADMSTGHKT